VRFAFLEIIELEADSDSEKDKILGDVHLAISIREENSERGTTRLGCG
jgi:hypothetical protein